MYTPSKLAGSPSKTDHHLELITEVNNSISGIDVVLLGRLNVVGTPGRVGCSMLKTEDCRAVAGK